MENGEIEDGCPADSLRPASNFWGPDTKEGLKRKGGEDHANLAKIFRWAGGGKRKSREVRIGISPREGGNKWQDRLSSTNRQLVP